MLIVMDKSAHEERSYQPLLTIRQFKITVTFITCYYGIFNITNRNKKNLPHMSN